MLKEVLKKAQENKYAIGQFNFSTLDQLRGILAGAKNLQAPIILGTSEGELNYIGLEEVVALVEISKNKSASWRRGSAPIFLNLDHGRDLNLIKKCVDYGFSAVHFDGSDLPLEKNTEYAKKIVRYAHKKGVLVEGEIESIGQEGQVSLEDIEKFVKETGVDSIAPSVGNIHGMHKKVKLDLKRLKEVSKINSFIVLHGGSGISRLQIKKAIKLGVVKININTEIRLIWKQNFLKALKKKEIKPYKIISVVEKAIQKKVEEKIKLFGGNKK
ncbi:class II fructose-bisphosphate aldolase [Patescibacteria group bacterium]|nr:class II fructose-bisphosphate aldolase [Patescibacteria group bacterium]